MGGLGAGGGKHLSAPGAFRLCLAGGAVGGVVKLLYQFFKFFAALRAAVLQDRHAYFSSVYCDVCGADAWARALAGAFCRGERPAGARSALAGASEGAPRTAAAVVRAGESSVGALCTAGMALSNSVALSDSAAFSNPAALSIFSAGDGFFPMEKSFMNKQKPSERRLRRCRP